MEELTGIRGCGNVWPENLWLGVSATNQGEALSRLFALHESGVPRSRTFLSLEPLADWLIATALGRPDLAPLPDGLEDRAHGAALTAAGLSPRR